MIGLDEQLITINPDGSITSLDFKGKSAVALRTMGNAETDRISEILWDADYQSWYIQFCYGPRSQSIVTPSLAKEAWGSWWRSILTRFGKWKVVDAVKGDAESGKMIVFHDYEVAVAVEVNIIQTLREKGLAA